MRITKRALCFFILLAASATAQSTISFPSPDAMFADAKHKEPKSGVQFGPGNTLIIQSGVGTPTTINAVAFSQDDKIVAAAKDFGRIVIWDASSQSFLRALDSGQGIVTAVALSGDGQLIATAGQGDEFSLKLWHLPDGRLVRTYHGFNGYTKTAAFGPAGKWVVVWNNFGGTHVLDTASDNSLLDLKDEYSPLLSPQGDAMMTVSKTSFTLWSTSDWKQKKNLPKSADDLWPLAVDPQMDRALIVSGRPGSFRLLRLSTGELIPSVQKPELPQFNLAAGGFAAFGSGDTVFGHSAGRLWAWNTKSGHTCVSNVMYSEAGALSPDGTLLAGAKDNSILAHTRSGEGVWLWQTEKLIAACSLR
jgi:WD40 repeat protein